MAALRNSWSDLHQEVLELIFDCVKDPIDILRCRIVCKSWLMGCSQFYKKYFPLCLIQKDSEEDSRTLFMISTKETSKIHLPEAKGQYICSLNNGWLLTVDHAYPHQIRLLNLISRAQILLPPCKTLSSFWSITRVETLVKKAIVSTCPYSSNLVILLQYNRFQVAFCRAGDEEWSSFHMLHFISDIMLYKDRFYGVATTGEIYYFQPSLVPKESAITNTRIHLCMFKYMVESVDGDIFVGLLQLRIM